MQTTTVLSLSVNISHVPVFFSAGCHGHRSATPWATLTLELEDTNYPLIVEYRVLKQAVMEMRDSPTPQ